MTHTNFLKKFQVTEYEFIFYLALITIFTLGIGYVDGIIFDTYVKPDMEGVEDFEAVGQPYQSIMFGAILWIALGFAVIRVVMGLLAGAKLTAIIFLTGGLYFVSTLIFHNTGWTDYFYYTLRKITIPTDMDWLNEMGLFQWVRFATGNENVNPTDLYIGMGIGVLVLLTLMIAMLFPSYSHSSKRESNAHDIIRNHSLEQQKEYNLTLIGSGTSIPDKIRGFILHYISN